MDETLRAATYVNKGGTGKSTVTAHLGVAAARQGHSVLLIDLSGKQGDLSQLFGIWSDYQREIDDGIWPNIATVFDEGWPKIVDRVGDQAVDDLIYSTGELVDIIPAHPGLDGVDAELATIDDTQDRYSRFKTFLDDYIDQLRYDLILIDLPGHSDNITYNGLLAAENVVAPVQMGAFETSQIQQLRADISTMRKSLPLATNLEMTMLVPNMVRKKTRLSDEYLNHLADEFPERLAPAPVPKSQDVRNAADRGQTLFRLSDPSPTAERARKAFITNTEELIRRLQSQRVEA